MRDYEELVKALREHAEYTMQLSMYDDLLQAADAIEELQKVLDAVNDANNEGFNIGYWAGRCDYEPKWIPVTERLPFAESGDVSQKVLVTDGQDMAIAEWFNFEMCEAYWSYTGIGDIKHWMPLPEPPKEEKANGQTVK